MLWDAYDIPNECCKGNTSKKSVDISIVITVDMKTFIKRNILKSVSSDFFLSHFYPS